MEVVFTSTFRTLRTPLSRNYDEPRLFGLGPDFQRPDDDVGGGGSRCPSRGDPGYGQRAQLSRPAGARAAAPGLGSSGIIVIGNFLIVVDRNQAEDDHRMPATC